MAPLPVYVTASAEAAINSADAWWRENRPKAPSAFVEELERSTNLIRTHPAIGAPVRNATIGNVRRLHLGRVHYQLYYRVLESPPAIEILALWHTSRGSAPFE